MTQTVSGKEKTFFNQLNFLPKLLQFAKIKLQGKKSGIINKSGCKKTPKNLAAFIRLHKIMQHYGMYIYGIYSTYLLLLHIANLLVHHVEDLLHGLIMTSISQVWNGRSGSSVANRH